MSNLMENLSDEYLEKAIEAQGKTPYRNSLSTEDCCRLGIPPYIAPLLEVFMELRRHRLPLGIDNYLDLLHALQAGIGLTSREDLESLCCLLWAKSDQETKLVRRLFQQLIWEPLANSPPAKIEEKIEEPLPPPVDEKTAVDPEIGATPSSAGTSPNSPPQNPRINRGCHQKTPTHRIPVRGCREGGNRKFLMNPLWKSPPYMRYYAWLNPLPEPEWAGTSAAKIAEIIPMFSATPWGMRQALATLRGKVK